MFIEVKRRYQRKKTNSKCLFSEADFSAKFSEQIMKRANELCEEQIAALKSEFTESIDKLKDKILYYDELFVLLSNNFKEIFNSIKELKVKMRELFDQISQLIYESTGCSISRRSPSPHTL